MVFPIWILLFLMMLLGGFALAVGLGTNAGLHRRSGTAAAAAVSVLILIGLVFGAAFLGVRSVPNVHHAELHVGPVSVQHQFDGVAWSGPATDSYATWFKLLLVAMPIFVFVAIGFVLMLPARTAPGSRSRWIPAGVALLFLCFLAITGIRWAGSRQITWHDVHLREQIEQAKRDVENQHEVIRRQARELAQRQRALREQSTFYKEIDQFDAPRIKLTEECVEPVAAMTASASNAGRDATMILTSDGRSSDAAELTAEAAAAVAAITGEDEPATTDESNEETASEPAEATEATANESEPSGESTAKHDVTAEKAENGESAPVVKNEKKVVAEKLPVAAKPAVVEAEPKLTQAEPRPDWIDDSPKRVGQVTREVIATDEYASTQECGRALSVLLLLKAYDRLQELNGQPSNDEPLPSITLTSDSVMANGQVIALTNGRSWNWIDPQIRQLHKMGINSKYLTEQIVWNDGTQTKQYLEQIERSFGPMYRLHTLVEFRPSFDDDLLRRWQDFHREGRLASVGMSAGGVLGLLGVFYGLLKVDTWTKGYYTKRLFLGVPAAIIGLGTLVALLAS